MNRLTQTSSQQLPSDVVVPKYNRHDVKPGILHFGIGAFHRAHQAYYTEAVLNQSVDNWGIIGCSLRSAQVKQQMAAQDYLYTVVERSGNSERYQIIGAVQQVLVAQENPAAVIATLADPTIKIVSLTITEKGYCHDPASRQLNEMHPDIIHDLAHLDRPRSAIGYLVAGLQLRYQSGIKSFTVVSCDNLQRNGELLAGVVKLFARKISPDLADWIQANTTFPNTMVDRMVPATTQSDRDDLAQRLGVIDEAMVVCEPFSQWIIEDRFADGRPNWENVGVQFVESVERYENAKLHMLNGAHSILAYTGYLSGFTFVSDVMSDAAFKKMITLFLSDEAGAALASTAQFDVEHYQQQLLERFNNSALRHRTAQIAMDGSQKIPQRLLTTLNDQLKTERQINIVCLGIAAWIRYVSGVDDHGVAINVVDPMAEVLEKTYALSGDSALEKVSAFFSLTQIFGLELSQQHQAVALTASWLERFMQKGVLNTIQENFGS